MLQIKTKRQLVNELQAIKSRHLIKHDKACTKRDALYHRGVIDIVSYSLAAVKHRRLYSLAFGIRYQFTGSRQLRRELEAREARANQQRAWCISHDYWTLAQSHAGEARACEALLRMMGG